MKRSLLKRKTPLKRSAKPMRRASTALAARRRQYSKQRKVFLNRPENQWCPVAAAGLTGHVWLSSGRPRLEIQTTDVHHRKGRDGKLLLDERYWLAVSRAGHEFIHANPNEARKHGWLA